MPKDYLKDKASKQKSAFRAGWLIALAVFIFAALIIKFALSGSALFNGLPDSDAAYTVAKKFITPTIRYANVSYSDSEYKYAKQSDSVYVIKSSYTSVDGTGDKSTTNFKITLKYNGGMASKTSNWSLLNLVQGND
ncbi:hypothetical protein ACFQZX_11000 [Mucilaginibacter litoreus]|uniref:Cytochrome oxidase complex assembly protein 1 n=1 Tax=Mucilaginibacter litoreus TaxID=1048221 RepID=A0ABW3ASV1_9SPHI